MARPVYKKRCPVTVLHEWGYRRIEIPVIRPHWYGIYVGTHFDLQSSLLVVSLGYWRFAFEYWRIDESWFNELLDREYREIAAADDMGDYD